MAAAGVQLVSARVVKAFVLVALGCGLIGCSSSSRTSTVSSTSTASSTSQPRTWRIVALGDSVPRGTNCDCTPYPPLTAKGLASHTGQTVTAVNDSVAGYKTSDVLHQLQADESVIDHVRSADVVEIEIGANDVAYSGSCGTATDCYAPRLATMKTNLETIVRRVHEITAGHHVLLVLLDYWSVWLGGQYAAAKGDAYVDAAAKVTDQVNTAIKATAAHSGSAYVDLRAAFKGPDYTYDETHYLSNDGDHPNAAGHQQIAAATQAVIENTLHI
ncbi:MAG: SGNH/GDSL hydrolase family protein [Acidimicrobiales bacterium]